jgi:hypothetical protein
MLRTQLTWEIIDRVGGMDAEMYTTVQPSQEKLYWNKKYQ